jgi:hypothetical protein
VHVKINPKKAGWGFLSEGKSQLPAGIFAAGAATGPTDILTARSQGEVAAQQILQHLNKNRTAKTRPGGRWKWQRRFSDSPHFVGIRLSCHFSGRGVTEFHSHGNHLLSPF